MVLEKPSAFNSSGKTRSSNSGTSSLFNNPPSHRTYTATTDAMLEVQQRNSSNSFSPPSSASAGGAISTVSGGPGSETTATASQSGSVHAPQHSQLSNPSYLPTSSPTMSATHHQQQQSYNTHYSAYQATADMMENGNHSLGHDHGNTKHHKHKPLLGSITGPASATSSRPSSLHDKNSNSLGNANSSSFRNSQGSTLPPPTRETVLQRLSEALLRRSLAKIDLSQKGLTPQDARLVKMALLKNRQLRVLKLGYNQLGDAGLETLVPGIAQHAQLQSLDLGFNNIGDVGCMALAQALDTTKASPGTASESDDNNNNNMMSSSISVSQLQTLYLAGNCIGQDGAMALADVIRRGGCYALQRLYLTGNRLGPDGVRSITEAILEEATMRRAENAGAMDHTPTTETSPFRIVPTSNTSHHGMQELFLGGTGLGPAGCQAVARLLASPDCRLKVLSLPNCDITDDEIVDGGLASSIKTNRDNLLLKSLQLSFNNISHKGLEALMNALWGSRTLQELRLDNNDIGDRGAQQLAAILPYLKTLETLDVGFNNINNKCHGMKILMKAVAEASHLITLSISGNPMQDVTSAKAVAYALAYNTSLQSLHLVHCHLTTEGQRHIAAGAVSNSRTSLRELAGFHVGPVIVTLGFPDALEHWTNEQVLNFIHLMWKKTKNDGETKEGGTEEERGLDPLSFLPGSNSSPNDKQGGRPGPLEATIVVDVARKAFASLVANGVDVFSRQPGHPNASSSPAVVAPRDAIMLESVDGDSIVESMGEVAVSSSPPTSAIDFYASEKPIAEATDPSSSTPQPISSTKKDQARSFVAPPQERTATKQSQLPDPSRKKRIVEWLCSNIKHLNKLAQMPFDSGELLKLHQHYFTPVVNESGGTSGFHGQLTNSYYGTTSYSDDSSRQAFSVPNVSRGSSNVHHFEDSSAMSLTSSATLQSGDVNMVPLSDPVFSAGQQQQKQHRPYQQPQAPGAVASSLPMLKRKVSYRFLGDAAMPSQQLMPQQHKNGWGGGFGGTTNLSSVSKMIEEGPTGHSLPPKNKKARRNRTRISFVPRIKAKLDSYLDVCHEKALTTMRQLYYVEQAILNSRVNPLDNSCPRTHLSGASAADAETIVVDMI